MVWVLAVIGVILLVCVIGLCIIAGKMLLDIAEMMDDIGGRK